MLRRELRCDLRSFPYVTRQRELEWEITRKETSLGLKEELEIGRDQEHPLEDVIVKGERRPEGWEMAGLVKGLLSQCEYRSSVPRRHVQEAW